MTLQTIPLIQVYDYVNLPGSASQTTGPAQPNIQVTATLLYDQATFASPVVALLPQPVTASVGADGYWTMYLAANNKINPANTTWLIKIPGYQPYQISVSDVSVPANGWQSSAILVTSPSALGASTPTGHVSTLTVDGAVTFTAGPVTAAAGIIPLSAVSGTVATKTTTYTAVNADIILADASGGAFTITLPAASNRLVVVVKKIDNTGNLLTISPAAGTIDGQSTHTLAQQYTSVTLTSDGSNWFVI